MTRRAGTREASGRQESRSAVTYTTEFGKVPAVQGVGVVERPIQCAIGMTHIVSLDGKTSVSSRSITVHMTRRSPEKEVLSAARSTNMCRSPFRSDVLPSERTTRRLRKRR